MDAPSDIKVSPTVHNKIFNALEGQLFNEHDNCDMYKEIYRYKDSKSSRRKHFQITLFIFPVQECQSAGRRGSELTVKSKQNYALMQLLIYWIITM